MFLLSFLCYSLSGISEIPSSTSINSKKKKKIMPREEFILDCTSLDKSKIPSYYDFKVDISQKSKKI